MGLALMSGIVPDEERAYQVFTAIRNKGESASSKDLALVGMIGQAYARRNHERTDELEVLTSDIRRMAVDVVPQIALDQAPDELRRYYFEALSDR